MTTIDNTAEKQPVSLNRMLDLCAIKGDTMIYVDIDMDGKVTRIAGGRDRLRTILATNILYSRVSLITALDNDAICLNVKVDA